MSRIRAIVLAVITLWVHIASAAEMPRIELDGRHDYPVVGVVQMMRDPSARLTVDALVRGEAAERFKPIRTRAPGMRYGFGRDWRT